ncbi:MAG: hypothetical protein KGL39_46445 [Patescibacteria group bacterium]|nr:hypothetical protein [Patescibacteria group bacterium]
MPDRTQTIQATIDSLGALAEAAQTKLDSARGDLETASAEVERLEGVVEALEIEYRDLILDKQTLEARLGSS